MLVVDVANVMGSRPDGWWRDRAGAAARLVAQVRSAVVGSSLAGPVAVVVEGAARRGVEVDDLDGVEVVHSPGEGDDAIVEVVRAATGAVTVVTADRELRRRCQELGAEVVGPGWLLDRLDPG